jgi:hypothetical protein
MRRLPGLPVARGAALLVLGALAVHQLRYLIAFGADSGEALHSQGHSYLAQALPVLVALAVALAASTVVAGALARESRHRGHAPGVARRALAYAAALLVVFAVQELVEGALSEGHPAGITALVAAGGWIALPLALAFGLAAVAVELLLLRAEGAVATALGRRPPRRRRAGGPSSLHGRAAGPPLAATPLAFGLARRPPPLASRL